MRTGRPTEENKNETLQIRVPYRQSKWLKIRAYRENITVSEYVRQIIEKEMDDYYSKN